MSILEVEQKEFKKTNPEIKEFINNEYLYSAEGYYCLDCQTLCEVQDYILRCSCYEPLENIEEEILNEYESEYPNNWIKVQISAKKI